MKLAHLILAHNNPAQLQKLVQRLFHPDADVYIHIDKKAALEDFAGLKAIPQVFFVANRVKVFWGGYSIVQATVNGFKSILASGKQYDYINLLSGQDYPVKSTKEIHRFLQSNPDKAFMEFYSVNNVWKEAIPRLTKYHLTHYRFAGKHLVEKWMNKLSPERKMPENLVAVGRSQWFTITQAHVKYIVDYLEEHPKVVRFFSLTWGSDEIVFQTILFNSTYKSDMENNNLRLIDWSKGGASPKTFTMDDVATLMATDKLFARKFSGAANDPVIDFLDNYVQH